MLNLKIKREFNVDFDVKALEYKDNLVTLIPELTPNGIRMLKFIGFLNDNHQIPLNCCDSFQLKRKTQIPNYDIEIKIENDSTKCLYKC